MQPVAAVLYKRRSNKQNVIAATESLCFGRRGGVKSVINIRRFYLYSVENEYCFRLMRTALALVMERRRKSDCRLVVTSNLCTPVKIFGSIAVVSFVSESILFISLYFGLLSSELRRIAMSGK